MVTEEENDQSPPVHTRTHSKHNKEHFLYITSLNVRTLATEERLTELTYAMENIKWDILGLCEVRRENEVIEEYADFILYHSYGTKGRNGVGYLIKKHLKEKIMRFETFSDRVALVELQIVEKGKPNSWTIIQVYAPTEMYDEEAVDYFYETLENAINSSNSDNLIVMGDFNAQIGRIQSDEEVAFGSFSHGKRSKNGKKLIEFALENNFKITNTMFRLKPHKKWTWQSPNAKCFNEIDFILTNKHTQITKFDIVNPNFNTDHRMIRCQMSLKTTRKFKRRNSNLIRSIPELSVEKKGKLENIFKDTTKSITDIQSQYIKLHNEIKSLIKEIPTQKMERKNSLSAETRQLLEERRILFKEKRSKETKNRIANISKKINKNITKDKRKHRQRTLETYIEKSGALKKAFKELQNKTEWTANLKTKRNKKLTRRPDILQEATNFYEELYASNHQGSLNLNTKENQDKVYVPEILKCEIEHAVRSQKNEKAPGDDNLTNEILKSLLDSLLNPLQEIFNKILRYGQSPEDWSKSTTILLHKKGDRSDLGNYRPISLMSNLYKIFSKIILNRLSITLDENQPAEQAGFRKNFSTVDHIQVVTQIVGKCREYNKTIYVGFIDFTKAFDSLEHIAIWDALCQQGVEEVYVKLLHNIYSKSSAKIRLEKEGPEFPIRRGVRQGDPLSPKIFCSVLEMIFRNIDWKEEGIKINGEYLSHLRFADDVVVFAETSLKLEEMLRNLAFESKKVGLSLNASKTKIITNGEEQTITVDETKIEYVKEYIYLGQSIAFEDHTEKEIDRRVAIAWKKFWGLKEIMKNKNINISIKRKVYDVAILPCLIYGCQTWALRKEDENKLAVCQRKMERSMLGLKLSDKINNSTIRNVTKVRDIRKTIRLMKWSWAGHTCRMDNNRWTKKAIEWIPRDEKRKRGRPKRRWEDIFIQRCGTEWMRQARDRTLWLRLGEAYANEAAIAKIK